MWGKTPYVNCHDHWFYYRGDAIAAYYVFHDKRPQGTATGQNFGGYIDQSPTYMNDWYGDLNQRLYVKCAPPDCTNQWVQFTRGTTTQGEFDQGCAELFATDEEENAEGGEGSGEGDGEEESYYYSDEYASSGSDQADSTEESESESASESEEDSDDESDEYSGEE